MKPVKFKQQNTTFVADDCVDLPVHKSANPRMIISCWKASLRERIKFLFTGTMWFGVVGTEQPPICLTVDTFFEKRADQNG